VSNRKKKITLAVNGQERIITADPESSLLDAIRDDMRESSVQLRCGCDIPIWRADGRSIASI